MVWLGEITLAIETFIDHFVCRKLPTVVVCDRLHPLLMGGQVPHNFRGYGLLLKRVFAFTLYQEYPAAKFLLNVGNHLRGHLEASRRLTTLLCLSLGLLGPVSPLTMVPA